MSTGGKKRSKEWRMVGMWCLSRCWLMDGVREAVIYLTSRSAGLILLLIGGCDYRLARLSLRLDLPSHASCSASATPAREKCKQFPFLKFSDVYLNVNNWFISTRKWSAPVFFFTLMEIIFPYHSFCQKLLWDQLTMEIDIKMTVMICNMSSLHIVTMDDNIYSCISSHVGQPTRALKYMIDLYWPLFGTQKGIAPSHPVIDSSSV